MVRAIIISSRAGVGRDAALAKYDAVAIIAEPGDGWTDLPIESAVGAALCPGARLTMDERLVQNLQIGR